MAQYVDIMTDAGFKAVFQDKQVTIKFLNAALAGERQIKDITYLDKEIKPEIVENRTIIFDLLCEDVSGAKFILEMQNCPQYYFFNRGFYIFVAWWPGKDKSASNGNIGCYPSTESIS